MVIELHEYSYLTELIYSTRLLQKTKLRKHNTYLQLHIVDGVEWVSVSAHIHVPTVWVKSDKCFVWVFQTTNINHLLR